MIMAKVRVSDGLKDRVKEEVSRNDEYDTQKEFVSEAIRRLLEKKEDQLSQEEIIQRVKEDIKKGEISQ